MKYEVFKLCLKIFCAFQKCFNIFINKLKIWLWSKFHKSISWLTLSKLSEVTDRRANYYLAQLKNNLIPKVVVVLEMFFQEYRL